MRTVPTRRRFLTGLGVTAGAVLVPGLGTLALNSTGAVTYRHVPVLGTRVSFAVRHGDPRLAREAIRAGIRAVFEVHGTMTLHEPSPLTHLNTYGLDQPQQVPTSLWSVLRASRDLHRQTGGLFDATMGRLIRQLQDTTARGESLPSEAAMQNLRQGIGWDHVVTDDSNRTVTLTHPHTSLDFSGIAKGFAVDQAAAALRRAGVEHFLVHAGGDLYAAGSASPWSRGWPVHLQSSEPGRPPLRTFMVRDQAVATSGNTARPRRADGQRIEHLVHPDLGLRGGNSVTATALANSVMEADAWSTAAFVGSPSDLAARLSGAPPGLEIHLTDRSGRVERVGV